MPGRQLHWKVVADARLQIALFLHGLDEHQLIWFSHKVPLKPGGQSQKNDGGRSKHAAPFKHGFGVHFVSAIWQKAPEKPGWHWHRTKFGYGCVHTPLLTHGLLTQ